MYEPDLNTIVPESSVRPSGLVLVGRFDCVPMPIGWRSDNFKIPEDWWIPGPNVVVDAACNDMLSVYFKSGTQKPNWFIGLIDNAGFSAISASDTASSHSGWAEVANGAYSESTRPAWNSGSPSGRVLTSSSATNFTMAATTVVKGGFLISDSTKGGTSGTLWSAGAYGANQSLVSGQIFATRYTLTLTPS